MTNNRCEEAGIAAVPGELVDTLAEYIRYGAVDDPQLFQFEPLVQEAWHNVAVGVTDYTRSLGRIMTQDERLDLFVRASQKAFDEHQRDKLAGADELLAVPAKFLNPRIVSEEGWMYIHHFYRHRIQISGQPAA